MRFEVVMTGKMWIVFWIVMPCNLVVVIIVVEKCIASISTFNPASGGSALLQNVGSHLEDYTALRHRRSHALYFTCCFVWM
jgi:hypothetical protein